MTVELRRVGWVCPREGRWWFRFLDASVPSGRTLGLCCPVGPARTVLADLLTGVQRPSVGQVLVAGVDLEDLSAVQLARWRRRRVRRWRRPDRGTTGAPRLDLPTVRAAWSGRPELLILEGPMEALHRRKRDRVAELLRWMRPQRRCTCVLLETAMPTGACDVVVSV